MEMNLIAQLKDTRTMLREALGQLSFLENKFLGPRPKEGPGVPPSQSDSVAVLLSEIRTMSASIVKLLNTHHDVVGDFSQEECAAGNPVQAQPRYA